MKKAILVNTNPFFLEENNPDCIALIKEDYELRIGMLRSLMKENGLDIVLIYGDREHFSNLDYFSGYDCRFEESILVIPVDATPTILVGNEGMSYSYVIPYEVNRVFYRHFSLQGQPRNASEKLSAILEEAGVKTNSKVGVIGPKYAMDSTSFGIDPKQYFDIPYYIMNEIYAVADKENVINCTDLATGLDCGIRLRVHNAKEIARAESRAAKSSAAVVRMLKSLCVGISETEWALSAGIDFDPVTMFSLANLSEKSVGLGLRSPQSDVHLTLGSVAGACYGIRGSLTSRVAVAAYDENSMGEGLKDKLFSFYGKFYEAMGAWLETLKVGVSGHDLHWAVHNIIGGDEYNVELNAGHFTGEDEWVNALSYDGSPHKVPNGAYMQVDIIASNSSPTRTAICEDTVIVANADLRAELKAEYPEVYERIVARQKAIRSIGIDISDDVLPLSNLNAAMFPLMLNLGKMFALS